MIEPRRFLLDPDASPFERDLLESWSAEQPAPAARARALAIGGFAASGAALAGAAGAGAAPKAMSLAGMAFVKWGFLGVLVLGVAAATALGVHSSSSEPNAPVVTNAPAVPPLPAAPAAAEPTKAAEIAATDLPAAEPVRTTAAPVVKAAPPAAPTATSDSLVDEISAFDGVRAASASGDPDRTLALAAAYERRYPNGTFLQEAEVLRIESLAKEGDSDGAARLGRAFLAAHPQSPHAGRIRAIVDTSTR